MSEEQQKSETQERQCNCNIYAAALREVVQDLICKEYAVEGAVTQRLRDYIEIAKKKYPNL